MNNAFTILEVLIAVFLISMGMFGIFTLIWQISYFTFASFDELTATYLLQEGLELVRNIRDSNWLAGIPWDYGLTNCGGGCGADYNDKVLDPGLTDIFLKSDGQFVSYENGQDTRFKRKIFISENIMEEYLYVQVEVSWAGKGREQRIIAEEKLYNWY